MDRREALKGADYVIITIEIGGLDPLTSSILTLDEIKKMVDEMLEGETRYLPKF